MRKVISYSCWGSSLKYLVGMLRNIEGCRRFYPGWDIVIYGDRAATAWLLDRSDFGKDIKGFFIPDGHWCPRMMQRYLIADDPTVERFLSRDADSRISQREVDAVNEWIAEDRILHVMRDHPAHCRAIMGGLFGLMPRRSNWEMPSMVRLMKSFLAALPEIPNPHAYLVDELFLATQIWPWAKVSATQHASVCREHYPGAKPFPTPRKDFPRFVGEVWKVNDDWTEQPRDNDWRTLGKEE